MYIIIHLRIFTLLHDWKEFIVIIRYIINEKKNVIGNTLINIGCSI